MQCHSFLAFSRLIALRLNRCLLAIIFSSTSALATSVHAASVITVGDGDSIRVL